MKYLKILCITLLFLVPLSTAAQNTTDEHIEEFNVSMNVRADGSITVTESILYNFGAEAYNKHGIIRDIPKTYDLIKNKNTTFDNYDTRNDYTLDIAIQSITNENGVPYQWIDEGYSDLRLRIGDANTTVEGKKWYIITYEMQGAIGGYDTYDEIYWNATGNGWDVPIEYASATITLPEISKTEDLRVQCFTGSIGSTRQNCNATVESPTLINYETRDLLYNEGLTIALAFQKGMLPEEALFYPAKINEYTVTGIVDKDTNIRITEKILYDSGSLSPYSLTRDFLNIFGTDINNYTLPITIHSVTDENGTAYNWTDYQNTYSHPLTIYPQSGTFEGKHTLIIDYTIEATGIPLNNTGQDRIYWNITGTDWGIPIESAYAVITIPEGSTVENNSADCFIGYESNSLEGCNAKEINDTQFQFFAENIPRGLGFAIAANFEKETVNLPAELTITGTPSTKINITLDEKEIATTSPVRYKVASGERTIGIEAKGYFPLTTKITLNTGDKKTTTYDLQMTPAHIFRTYLLPPLSMILVALLTILFWWATGRDPKGRGTIIPEYKPPKGMTPGEMGVIIDNKVQIHDITASVIQLAVKGYIKIKKGKKTSSLSKIKGNYDYTFIKIKEAEGADELANFEQTTFKGIFGKKDEKKLSHLKNSFYKKLPKIKKELYTQTVTHGYYKKSPEKARASWIAIGILVGMTMSAIFLVIAVIEKNPLYFFGVSNGVIIFITSFFMTKRTQKGVEVLEKIQGFKQFLTVAEKDRLKFFNSPKAYKDIFEKYLPFAVALKVEDQWAEQFKDIFDIPPDWYDGGGEIFSALSFSQAIRSLNSATASTFVSAPTSSGTNSSGSSSFSGGGFSGGGFGGGGGSSW